MKEEELKELVRLTEMSLKFEPVLNPKQFNVFHKFLDKAREEGRQSKLKEVLGMIDKLSITQKEGCPVTIKAGTRFIFTEELKKELAGVNQ